MDHKILCRILITVLLLVLFHFLPLTGIIRLFLYLIPWLIIGYDILLEAAKHLLHGKVFDENFLMVLATVGAIVIGEYPEATAVMLFYRIGELLEDLAVGKSRKSIRELMDIRPDHANILNTEGKPIRVSPESVLPGTMILVSPGERIPLDGLIEEGASSLDTSALTGESLPHEVCVGDQVISGCVNLSGLISVRVTKPFGESTASRIMDLAENAAERKSHAERFINRFAAVYTPVVCVLALLLFLIPTLLSGGAEWRSWLYRAMTLLVISCPCSLVISIPLTFFAGIGGAGRRGILVRSADTLEAVSDIRTILFDKTGTLTKGNFEVIGIRNATVPEKQLLELAACAECFSVHPISRSLVAAYGAEPDRTRVSDVREASGKGVSATVDGRNILTGNEQFLVEHGVDVPACTAIGTLVHIASDGHFLGTIVISDVLKPGIREAIRSLRDQGIRKMVMLTGDHASVADQVASALGIDEVHSRLLPDEKVAETEKQLRQMAPGEKLAFVGDGVNDMPVIALADIGIAMGALGSDAAIEAADLVLMDDDPGKIVHAIRISRKCLRIARENIIFSLAVKLICVVLVATGNAGMSAGIFADTGVMILSVLNAIRALSVRKI